MYKAVLNFMLIFEYNIIFKNLSENSIDFLFIAINLCVSVGNDCKNNAMKWNKETEIKWLDYFAYVNRINLQLIIDAFY